jgi:hypothetical protein
MLYVDFNEKPKACFLTRGFLLGILTSYFYVCEEESREEQGGGFTPKDQLPLGANTCGEVETTQRLHT